MTARTAEAATSDEAPPQVVATAGHVDHGKSALILRLTGMDPDRFAEEKRRGLTIDLGFAWCVLPSGREIGFVDVPGHERFIANMLAGMGPVRLVLFVVAADEGWKPQSEEHLAIVDVLGAHGGIVALTKRDLVDEQAFELVAQDVRSRLAGTALDGAPVVACSSVTGEGLDELRDALDAMVATAPSPEQDARPRQFVDRVFTITGAGTVVTGTLTGGGLAVGDEVEIYPAGARARIRGLQTHKRVIQAARPVSRVASNLAGVERARLERGDVVGRPGDWRPTRTIEVRMRPVRGLGRPLTARGAYKLYAGSAERSARIRLYGNASEPQGAFARIRLSAPLVLDVGDRFVLREAGRRETVAGGTVLDVSPPGRPGTEPERRLVARASASREELPTLLIDERGAARERDVVQLTGARPGASSAAIRAGAWWVSGPLARRVRQAVTTVLAAFHEEHPLEPGAELALARAAAAEEIERAGRGADPDLVDALLDGMSADGSIARDGSSIRLASHRVTLAGREEEVERVVAAVRDAEPTPPSVPELVATGHAREVIDAATRAGRLVRASPELVFTPELAGRAEALLRATGPAGITVSAFREALGTSRKYAVPLLEHFDRSGLTKRQGDVRVLRNP